MVFSSIIFLYIFLPILIITYFITPNKLKNLVMIIASFTFYAWGEIRFIPVMLLLSVVDYVCGRKIDKYKNNKKLKKTFMLIDVLANISVLIIFKYANFFVANINSFFNTNFADPNIILPLGVSFNTFQSISYIIDVYRGTTTCEKSYYNYLTYTTLFPQIIAGPIVRYVTVEDDLEDRKISFENFSSGMRRFTLGLGKKVLIANNLGALWNIINTGGINDMSILFYWIGILAYTFQIYFDFSGYSDMAIGLARIFGLKFDENFNYPYISKSITEFWRRWHMTLSAWFRDYLYIPLGGNKKGKLIQARNILIVWTLTGFWHGASWNYVMWGFYFAILLVIEKFILQKFWNKIASTFKHIYTMFLVLISFAIFYFEDVSKLIDYLKGLFGQNSVPFINAETLYYLSNYLIIFIIATLVSTPICKKVLDRLEAYKNIPFAIFNTLIYLFIFISSTAYLVNSSYNPFLYFRF